MPGGDRTGPVGQGPVTGRGFGYCSGFDSPGFTRGSGRGMGRGFAYGYGRGMGRGFHRGWSFNIPFQGSGYGRQWGPSISKDDEIRFLKSEAEGLKRSQKEIERRLGELEKEE